MNCLVKSDRDMIRKKLCCWNLVEGRTSFVKESARSDAGVSRLWAAGTALRVYVNRGVGKVLFIGTFDIVDLPKTEDEVFRYSIQMVWSTPQKHRTHSHII